MNAIFEQIKNNYQNLQRKSESELNARKENAFKKSEVLKKLDDRIIQLSLQQLKAAISLEDASKERKRIAKEIHSLEKEIQQELIKQGFPKNYLSLQYACDACKDTGYIDSKTRCTCFERFILQKRMSDSGLKVDHATFEKFDDQIFSHTPIEKQKSQREFMTALKTKCENYAQQAPSDQNLIIMGHSGTGKSFLLECIVDRVLKRGVITKFYTATTLFGLFFKHRMGEDVDLDILYTLPVIAIDDLGTEIMTKNVTIEYFYNLISERTSNGLCTIISTNLDPQGITVRYGDRIFSRLFHKSALSYLIPIIYQDIRISSKN